jgi:hypothetical protein
VDKKAEEDRERERKKEERKNNLINLYDSQVLSDV